MTNSDQSESAVTTGKNENPPVPVLDARVAICSSKVSLLVTRSSSGVKISSVDGNDGSRLLVRSSIPPILRVCMSSPVRPFELNVLGFLRVTN